MAEPVPAGSATSGRRTRSFGVTVLLGIAGAALTALAGSREWATSTGEAAGVRVEAAAEGSDSAPLVLALALVALAAWGAILVTRGRVRRVLAIVGLAASAGAAAAVVLAFDAAQNNAVDAAMAKGATGDVFTSSLTAWYYLSGLAALATVAAFAVAVLRSPQWPAMGERYDAPAARRATPATDEDLWRALDEGRDPTS